MAVVTMRQLLESGVHFGHPTRRWNPKMKKFIFTERNGNYIIDLQQSLTYINDAFEFVKQVVAHGGTVLFVGTKRQAQEPIAEQALRVGMPYVNQRWLGGMLTNFQTVHLRLQRLKELELIDFDDVAGSGYTKKELLIMRREKEKLERTLGGIRSMAKVPSALWIVDTNKEHLAVDEAKKLQIPIVAILDTNCDPDDVQYKIPGNDDAIRSIALLTRVIADAVAEGLVAKATARSESKGDEPAPAAEPLTEWEMELLEGAEAGVVADEAVATATEVTHEADVASARAGEAVADAEVSAELAKEVAESGDVVAAAEAAAVADLAEKDAEEAVDEALAKNVEAVVAQTDAELAVAGEALAEEIVAQDAPAVEAQLEETAEAQAAAEAAIVDAAEAQEAQVEATTTEAIAEAAEDAEEAKEAGADKPE